MRAPKFQPFRDGLSVTVKFEYVDTRSLPFAYNPFDLVMAAPLLEHLPNPVVALKEISRILRPGGEFVACLTRESILGRYIQLQWRTHRPTPEQSESLFTTAGLDVHRPNVAPTGCLQRSSLVCLARKPTQI